MYHVYADDSLINACKNLLLNDIAKHKAPQPQGLFFRQATAKQPEAPTALTSAVAPKITEVQGDLESQNVDSGKGLNSTTLKVA